MAAGGALLLACWSGCFVGCSRFNSHTRTLLRHTCTLLQLVVMSQAAAWRASGLGLSGSQCVMLRGQSTGHAPLSRVAVGFGDLCRGWFVWPTSSAVGASLLRLLRPVVVSDLATGTTVPDGCRVGCFSALPLCVLLSLVFWVQLWGRILLCAVSVFVWHLVASARPAPQQQSAMLLAVSRLNKLLFMCIGLDLGRGVV